MCVSIYLTYRQILQLAVGQRRGLLVLEWLLIAKAWLRLRLGGVAQLDLERLAQTARRLEIHGSAELERTRATQRVMWMMMMMRQMRVTQRMAMQMAMCGMMSMCTRSSLQQQWHRLIAAYLHNQGTLLATCRRCQLLAVALGRPIAAAEDQWPLGRGRLTAGQAQQQQQYEELQRGSKSVKKGERKCIKQFTN